MSRRVLPLTQDCFFTKTTVPTWLLLVIFGQGIVGLCSFPWALRQVAEPHAIFPSQLLCACGLGPTFPWNTRRLSKITKLGCSVQGY